MSAPAPLRTRPPATRSGTSLAAALAALLALALLVACSPADPDGRTGDGNPEGAAGESSSSSASPTPEESQDPDAPLSWGPTAGELQEARELVAGWTPEQLAGQAIIGRFYTTDPAEPAALVEDLHLAGVQVTSSSIAGREQVRALTGAVAEAHAATGREFPAIVGVDQEGGTVSHLDGIATEFPSFATAGEAVEQAPAKGPGLVRDAARSTAFELRDLGFTWVFAPVADVTIGSADPTIGSRSPSEDPEVAADVVEAAVRGYGAGAVVSTTKHFPGHGAVTADSHQELPVLEKTLDDLAAVDLVPFRAAVGAQAPAVMMAHLEVPALAPGTATSLAPEAYEYLREELGFEGVTITDSLGMGAVVASTKPAVTAYAAGADLLLMPADTRRTHDTLTRAIATEEVPRERAEEAASRVVALQLWQQRVADGTPVPADVAEQAAAASAALSDAAY